VAQLTKMIPPNVSPYYRLEGRVDRPAVSELRRTLRGDAAASVTLDLSHVEFLDDATLAFLTMNLVAIGRRKRKAVSLRGLRQHQIRLLSHLGVDLAGDGSIQPRQERSA
jgi:anti-anti-sigma regulatory factor